MPQDGTRRSGRIPKQIAISLIGSDIEGRIFSEQTKTVVLSRHGAGIVSAYKLSPEQEIVIRSEESAKEIEARVVGQIGSDGDTYIYGVAFLDRERDFWGVAFPDLSETEKRASEVLLECSSCHTRETADLSDLASDVLAVNQSIVRYCPKCGSSTLWKQAGKESLPAEAASTPGNVGPVRSAESSGGEIDLTARPKLVASNAWRERIGPTAAAQPSGFAGAAWTKEGAASAEPTSDPSAPETAVNRADPSPPSDWDDASSEEPRVAVDSGSVPDAAPSGSHAAVKEQENRRKHVRTRVNFKACVRRPGFPDDIVACEDMSRGGLRFKSSKKYFEKMLIDVAVPYSPGGQAIFVPAQIAYVQELREQNVYRCGVMYLRNAGR